MSILVSSAAAVTYAYWSGISESPSLSLVSRRGYHAGALAGILRHGSGCRCALEIQDIVAVDLYAI